MPDETMQAIDWALQQQYEIESGIYVSVSKDLPFTVVDKVREYFNINNLKYSTFSYENLIPFLN